jgi:hypothetical protein
VADCRCEAVGRWRHASDLRYRHTGTLSAAARQRSRKFQLRGTVFGYHVPGGESASLAIDAPVTHGCYPII